MTGSRPPAGSPVIVPVRLGPVNAYLIKGDRAVLIDTGLPKSGPAILDVMEKNGIQPRDLTLIIITHAHGDHFGSAAFMKEATGAKVLAHTRDAPYLQQGMDRPPVPVTLPGRLMGFLIGRRKASPELAVVPDILIDAPCDLAPFGVAGTIIPTPGHTEGSLSVGLAGGEWFVGDLVMGIFPASRARLPLFAEDSGTAAENIRRIVAAHPAIIYPGHGGPFRPEQIAGLVR